jgi:hypothetical protein
MPQSPYPIDPKNGRITSGPGRLPGERSSLRITWTDEGSQEAKSSGFAMALMEPLLKIFDNPFDFSLNILRKLIEDRF